MEFKQSAADPCVYIRAAGMTAIVAVYVDDLLLIIKTAEEMLGVKEYLAGWFNPLSVELRELNYCITRRVSRGLVSILITTSLIRTFEEAPFTTERQARSKCFVPCRCFIHTMCVHLQHKAVCLSRFIFAI